MAGNVQGDNSGNILVEFDYNNIIIVDPNKTIDALGNIRERLVDHENLVMYANLEAEVVPRTKLSVGGSPEDRIRTISVAKMNFLRPTEEKSLTTGYYDELTGKNAKNGLGVNQMQEQIIDPKNGTKPYAKMTITDPGGKATDNGLLGITSINIKTNTSFVPSVSMSLEDIQGRALFQLGDNSPYSAFFNLPYCPFYLTLKGYYGQAIRYQLNLKTFNARFNSYSGNYSIELEFVGYKFNILNEVSMGNLLAAPHMYSTRFDISKSPTSPEGGTNKSIESQSKSDVVSRESSISTENITTELVTERGYQKIIEVYSEYKAKGLISPDFPEFTLAQLMTKLLTFENSIADKYTKADVEPLTNIRTYKETLKNYYNSVYGDRDSWFNTYLNPKPIILKGTGQEVYNFKQEFISNPTKKAEAISFLSAYTIEYNSFLAENPTLGKSGKTPIKNSITFNTMLKQVALTDINLEKTTTSQTGKLLPTTADTKSMQLSLQMALKPSFEKSSVDTKFESLFGYLVNPPLYNFEEFQDLLSNMETQANQKLSEAETALTSELAKKIEEKVGFNPTVRNICAVIMASAEGFIRLLDEVHTKAWNVKYDPIRQLAILDNPSSAQGTETEGNVKISQPAQSSNQGLVNGQTPVYPWPQFFVETPEDKKGRFQLKYIADPSVVDLTKGYLYEKWPEVEFVEEYMRGLTQKFNPPVSQPPIDSQATTNIINVNAIEYPSEGIAYANKEEIKFFYEIWERQFLTSNYSGFIRANNNQIDQLTKLIVSAETNNVVTSLGVSSPFLTLKLKNYDITAQNYPSFLENISNQGTGRAYQDYIRDFFVTPYIRNLTENSFNILSLTDLGKEPQTTTNTDGLLQLVKNVTNEPIIIDTYPFTDPTWVATHMANSITNTKNFVYNTNRVLTVFEDRDVISNFNSVYNYSKNRPVTNFSYLKVSNPTNQITSIGLDSFYLIRKDPTFFVPTEGYVNYFSPSKNILIETTTSMLNTPYFINAIQNGVNNWRRKDPYPYTQAAYLFINSLPLASLKEKYKTNGESSDLDYIASCFKKFGAIHKMPYAWVLKMGSIWYRYKTYINSNTDILESAWKNFDYKTNFDPVTSSDTKTYTFKFDGENKITLQNVSNNITKIQTGFYPKVINDFNVFYNGYNLYSGYTDTEIQESIDRGVKVYNFTDSNINAQTIVFPLITPTQYSTIQTWSVVLPNNTIDPTDVGNACNPSNNTTALKYYVVPSFGSQINQVKSECLINNEPKCIFIDNPSIYNGSVRLLWSSPNYGYFDNTQISKPQADSYINKIETGTKQQSPFKLLMDSDYSKIEEIFSVFDKSILDKFENEFLNFCKPASNIDLGLQVAVPIGVSPVDSNALFRNFQYLFTNMMEIDGKESSITNGEYFKTIGETQLTIFSNTIKAFLEYDVILKYGNPADYNRRVMASYLAQGGGNNDVVDPIIFNPYVKNSLPSSLNTITLDVSKSRYPNAWKVLETEVGFSTIPNLTYDNNGSYITDFFIDNDIEFTENNVVLLAPIIKMYATQKLYTPTLSGTEFKSRVQTYLGLTSNFQNNVLNQILTRVRKDLPDQQELPERAIQSVIDGQQSKVENYEVFKALNDKWIAGSDYTSKTLFEDVMFLDRASRNIGDTIIIDIFDLKNMLSENSLNMEMSVFTFMSGILIKNKFNVMPLPAYVNFYNIQEVDGTTIPQPEGSLEFADNMWGTFLNVDYRKSGPKMICFYAGQPSTHLDLPKGNSRFRDDAFDLRRASDNPLIENPAGKKDYAISNKCVGFNVDVGNRNQNIFYSIDVNMDSGKATSESIQTQLNMVNQYNGKNTATQNVGLYNLYKQRSYQCTVRCLGNALLQPTMYFNLRHVPMFNGPYFITQVDHVITAGNFQTSFTGTRQGIYDLPSINNFLQSINQNLLTKIESLVKNSKDDVTAKAITNVDKSKYISQAGGSTAAAQNSCRNNLAVAYNSFGDVQSSTTMSITIDDFVKELEKKTSNPKLQVLIYMICYAKTFDQTKFYGYANNYANVTLTTDYGPTGSGYFSSKKYSCVNIPNSTGTKTSQPVANFNTIGDFFDFMIARLLPRVNQVFVNGMGITKYYVCHWPVSNVEESYYDSHTSEFTTLEETFNKAFKSAGVAGLNVEATTELKVATTNQKKKNNNTLAGVTTPANNLNTTTNVVPSCPPPTITSFSPLTGVSGTILTIVGNNLDEVTGITINNVTTTTGITILNAFNISVVVPFSNNGLTNIQQTPIIVRGIHGSTVTSGLFTYNPSQVTPIPNNTNNTNTQPQQTGPVTLIENTQIGVNGSTSSLMVGVNPQVLNKNTWTLDQTVEMVVSVYDNNVVNNLKTKTLNRTVTIPIIGYVSKNVFNITHENLQVILVSYPIEEFKVSPITPTQTAQIKFTIVAAPTDRAINIQDVTQSFNFDFRPTQTTIPTFAEVAASIVLIGESPTLQGNGPQFFNIKKPDNNGYITFQFNTPSFQEQNYVEIYFLDSDGDKASSSRLVDTQTRYTYEYTLTGKGVFKLIVKYRPYGLKSPVNGQVLTQTVVGPPFTL
jgi:hypothetical protein